MMTPDFDPYERRLASFKPTKLPPHAKAQILSELARLDAGSPAQRTHVRILPAWAYVPLALAASLLITLELPSFLTGLVNDPMGAALAAQDSPAASGSQGYDLNDQFKVNTVAVLRFAWPGTNRSERLL